MKYKTYQNNTKCFTSDEEPYVYEALAPFNKPEVLHNMDFYLDEEIKEPKYYRNLLQFLFDMQEKDTCRIWINSPGGNLSSCVAIINAIQEAEGAVICIVNGSAYSAASMIALSAPNLIITEYSDFMLHTASFGLGGKTSDVVSRVQHEEKAVRKIMQECYEGFLTEEELEALLQGKDYWMLADEVQNRLEARAVLQVKVQGVTDDTSEE